MMVKWEVKREISEKKKKKKKKTTYLEIFGNVEKGWMRYNCYLDDILEREVKCVTTCQWSYEPVNFLLYQ